MSRPSSLPIQIVLLHPSGNGGPAYDRLLHSIRGSFSGLDILAGLSDAKDPELVLIPVDLPVDLSSVEQVFRQMIASGNGTVARIADGTIQSRMIPISEHADSEIPASVRFFLDGCDVHAVHLGAAGSPERDAFVTRIVSLRAAVAGSSEKQVDIAGLEGYIRSRFANEFPQYAYHNPRHIQDVYDASLRIAAAEGVTGSDLDLLRVAVLFHDAGFIHTTDRHEECGADMASAVLPAFGFTQEQVRLIRQMILATRVPQQPISILDRIICDADLDYLGRDDFYAIGNLLFQELKAAGVVRDETEWNRLQKKVLEAHHYHTDYSRINREPAKLARLGEVVSLLG